MGQAKAESKGATYVSEKNASNTRHSKPSMDELSLHVPSQSRRVLSKPQWVKPKIAHQPAKKNKL
jgi:hypothetical protein